jgi:hypothetical protein
MGGAYIEDGGKSRPRKRPPRRRRKVMRANVRITREAIPILLDLHDVRVCVRTWILHVGRPGALKFCDYHLFN